MESLPEYCPECGASQADGLDCWNKMGLICTWEFQDAELLAEHFLTVSCYNLQHPAKFTDEALANLKQSLIDRIDSGISNQELRQRASVLFDGPKRALKPEAERVIVRREWPITVADVYANGETEGAAPRVREWASSLRSLLQED